MKMKSNGLERWNIKLRVTSAERKQIQKEAIDNDMRVAEYIRLKLLGGYSTSLNLTQQKSS